MLDAFAIVMGLRALERARRELEQPAVPEPEFRPFVFPKREAVSATTAESRTVQTVQPPRTLEELGVPRPFAAEIEAAFRAMGALDGDQVTGFRFVTPDGVTHALRAGSAAAKAAKAGKAA